MCKNRGSTHALEWQLIKLLRNNSQHTSFNLPHKIVKGKKKYTLQLLANHREMLNHAQPNATERTHTILSHKNHIIFPKHQFSIVAPVVEERQTNHSG